MQPKLKENPREWQKFTMVMVIALALVNAGLRAKHVFPWFLNLLVYGFLGLALLVCWLHPAWFRGFYRSGMTVSFHLGQAIGKVILTLFFVIVLTPIGLLLRLGGKDLLNLKRSKNAITYWQPAKSSQAFNRLF